MPRRVKRTMRRSSLLQEPHLGTTLHNSRDKFGRAIPHLDYIHFKRDFWRARRAARATLDKTAAALVAGERLHDYAATVTWMGPAGGATTTYAGYSREHTIAFDGKDIVLRGSADRAFRGDPALVNPEELLLAALSACHMLNYLALCSLEGIEVLSYVDHAHGSMSERGGAGRFVSVTLEPAVEIARAAHLERATALHGPAHDGCFIANSVNFPVVHRPVMRLASEVT